ncbi:uncharacterized protein LOC124202560 [Daphnia pulex]|uniref:uncharacterized protein LOC124202560 n=1 Tax=Daphnia pulex TaxID=6669 RepID=UPI001EDE4227|nr:uncharacterized protein LOC124202560 [Daphnia pulex]
MNPVVVLLLVQLVAAQPVALPNPFAGWNTKPSSSKVSVLDTQPLSRTRSLPQTSQSTNGNHAGPVNTKNGGTFDKVGKIITTTTTTEPSTQQATVDIETLPGFWLKDPSRIEETTGSSYEVDYRTERYRLDDLLLLNKRRKNGYVGHHHEDEKTH